MSEFLWFVGGVAVGQFAAVFVLSLLGKERDPWDRWR